jgi:hypothetical protein
MRPNLFLPFTVLAFAACDLSGCGDANPTPAEDGSVRAGDSDAGSMRPDAGPTNGAAVTVYDFRGNPVPDTDVVVQGSDGRVKRASKTDADGKAIVEVASGDQVTAVSLGWGEDFGPLRQFVTWQAVEPGDALQLGKPAVAYSKLGTLTVHVPGLVPGALAYRARSTGHFVDECPEEDREEHPDRRPLTYDVFRGCHRDPAHLPVLLEAIGEQDIPLAYAYQRALPTGSPELTASFAAWKTDFLSFHAEVAHLPERTPVEHLLSLDTDEGERFETQRASAPDSGSVAILAPLGLRADAWTYAAMVTDLRLGDRWRVHRGAMPLPARVETDYANDFIAGLEALSYDDGIEPHRIETNITLGAGEPARTAVIVSHELVWPDHAEQWLVVAPGGTTSIRLPELPDSLAEFRPELDRVYTRVTLVDASDLDYVDVRRHPATLMDAGELLSSLPVKATDRTLRFSQQRFRTAE